MTIDLISPPGGPFAERTRMYAPHFHEIEGQQTADAGAWSAARRVVAQIDAPAPADPPASGIITLRSVEALAAAYGLLADAETGLIFVHDREGRQWSVGVHMSAPVLIARSSGNLRRSLPDLFNNGAVVLREAGHPVDLGIELAARIQSLLLLHGVRATAITYDGYVEVWDSTATVTSPEWNRQAAKILRTHYGISSNLSGAGALEIEIAKVLRTDIREL